MFEYINLFLVSNCGLGDYFEKNKNKDKLHPLPNTLPIFVALGRGSRSWRSPADRGSWIVFITGKGKPETTRDPAVTVR
jgi:hypothetical protein